MNMKRKSRRQTFKESKRRKLNNVKIVIRKSYWEAIEQGIQKFSKTKILKNKISDDLIQEIYDFTFLMIENPRSREDLLEGTTHLLKISKYFWDKMASQNYFPDTLEIIEFRNNIQTKQICSFGHKISNRTKIIFPTSVEKIFITNECILRQSNLHESICLKKIVFTGDHKIRPICKLPPNLKELSYWSTLFRMRNEIWLDELEKNGIIVWPNWSS